MKKGIKGMLYMLALALVLAAACFIISCGGCEDDETTTASGDPAITSTVGVSGVTTSAATTTQKADSGKEDPDGPGWITDKNGDPAYY